jgi:hypothetical protein
MSIIKREQDDVFDRINLYYKDEGKLSDQDLLICQRWELAFSLLQKHKSKSVAVKFFLKYYHAKGIKLNPATAYEDFKKAEKIFLPIHKVSKEMHRLVQIEAIDRDIKFLKKKQNQKNEDGTPMISDKVFLDIQSQISKLYELRIKATGIDKDDVDGPDFSKIQPPNIQINISPRDEKFIKNFVKNGVVDLDNYIDAEIVE